MKLLHVYGQGAWHEEVVIIGNREALEDLKATIEKAISEGRATATVFCNDGEGYEVYVGLNNSPWEGDSWNRAMVPYTEAYARGSRDNPLGPAEHLKLIERQSKKEKKDGD